jgi:hypothetical protein
MRGVHVDGRGNRARVSLSLRNPGAFLLVVRLMAPGYPTFTSSVFAYSNSPRATVAPLTVQRQEYFPGPANPLKSSGKDA